LRGGKHQPQDPLEVLKLRFARGEISREEVMAVFATVDIKTLDEGAASLGASPWQRFRDVRSGISTVRILSLDPTVSCFETRLCPIEAIAT
jgi:hypothetical protein